MTAATPCTRRVHVHLPGYGQALAGRLAERRPGLDMLVIDDRQASVDALPEVVLIANRPPGH
jgi:hypothetical protein